MSIPEHRPARRRSRTGRRVGVLAAILLVGLIAFALSRLELHRIGHALSTYRQVIALLAPGIPLAGPGDLAPSPWTG
jgi:hypothetical protein